MIPESGSEIGERLAPVTVASIHYTRNHESLASILEDGVEVRAPLTNPSEYEENVAAVYFEGFAITKFGLGALSYFGAH